MRAGMIAASAAALFIATLGSADAHGIIDVSQVGGNVEVRGSGTIDLNGLGLALGPSVLPAEIFPDARTLFVAGGEAKQYGIDGQISGPPSFGTGNATLASSSSGDLFGIQGVQYPVPLLVVPLDYVSGSPLLGSSTYDGATFASLGATPGTYVWTWGAGSHADSLTVVIGAAVPEPSTWAMLLLGFAGLGFAGYRPARRTTAALVTESERRAAPCLHQN